MAGEEPDDPPEYETIQKVGVDGNVVGEIRIKPKALLSDIEEEVFFTYLAVVVGSVVQDGEGDTRMLEKYDPEVQFWPDDAEDDEPSWSSPRNLSETQFLDEYENL